MLGTMPVSLTSSLATQGFTGADVATREVFSTTTVVVEEPIKMEVVTEVEVEVEVDVLVVPEVEVEVEVEVEEVVWVGGGLEVEVVVFVVVRMGVEEVLRTVVEVVVWLGAGTGMGAGVGIEGFTSKLEISKLAAPISQYF